LTVTVRPFVRSPAVVGRMLTVHRWPVWWYLTVAGRLSTSVPRSPAVERRPYDPSVDGHGSPVWLIPAVC